MKAQELRNKFIKFFLTKKHKQIPSASLIPENDPTVLFTTAGMHPLVPYLMGQSHPLGKRLCSVQKCLRTDDIDEVGDRRHFTFFEMLGNWSLGDYFKKEAIAWSFEFLTNKKWLGLDPQRIYISVFKGDQTAPMDKESIRLWQLVFKKVGIKAKLGERIFTYGKKENWWGPAGQSGPCGPDTEMFYDTGLPHDKKFGKFCHPNCQCGRFIEIWNDVFMEFNKKTDGNFETLKQKNVDTGLGLERAVALTEFIAGRIEEPDPFLTELFNSMIRIIELLSGKEYRKQQREFRIITDHLRASVFLLADGVEPSNKDRGYVLRRLIRRAIFKLSQLQIKNISEASLEISKEIIKVYQPFYKELMLNSPKILELIVREINKFTEALKNGMKYLDKAKVINGKTAFFVFETYGIPLDLSLELAIKRGEKFNKEEFERQFKKHQALSRKGAQQKFAGGLQDHSEQTTKLHTATHLLHAALRKVLGEEVHQVGSNITAERLRFDFTYPNKLTVDQLSQIEKLVNKIIKKNIKVECQTMLLKEALKAGALAFFGQKYPEKVKVYKIDSFSLEVCGGPHVDFTGKIGSFKIIKEEAVGTGKRRLYAKTS